MIVLHNQIIPRVKDLYASGGMKRGTLPGWRELDELYSVALGQWTVVTGTPNSGKSAFLDAMLVQIAKKEEWRFAIYSPEHWPLELHFAAILENYIGKPFNPGPTPRMNEDEVDEGLEWIQRIFTFCKPDKPSMAAILNEAQNAPGYIPMSRRWKAGIVVDPWNQLEHHRPHGMSETEYISSTLSMTIDWVREWETHLWLVAHPKKLERKKDGTYPIPTLNDISGSSHFWNKSDNGICVHRDQQAGSQNVGIHVQKIRFRHIGKQGVANLIYDRVTGRYHDHPDSAKWYNKE